MVRIHTRPTIRLVRFQLANRGLVRRSVGRFYMICSSDNNQQITLCETNGSGGQPDKAKQECLVGADSRERPTFTDRWCNGSAAGLYPARWGSTPWRSTMTVCVAHSNASWELCAAPHIQPTMPSQLNRQSNRFVSDRLSVQITPMAPMVRSSLTVPPTCESQAHHVMIRIHAQYGDKPAPLIQAD